MSIRLIHSSDIHWCREHQAEALESLGVIRDAAQEHEVDLVVLAGDLFDRGIQASDRDGMGDLIEIIQEILDIAPIAVVSGTPSHDVPGCYEILTHLAAANPFIMLDPDCPRVIGEPGDQVLVLGCPEPGKQWLLAGKESLGSAEATQAVNEAMRGVLLGLGGLRREHPDIPCIMVYHGAVKGATMAAGQTVGGTELAIGAEDLALVGADYYALGHIHMAQQVGSLPAWYAGSAYPCSWGELDQKSCRLVTLGEPVEWPIVETVAFPHAPRMKIVTTVAAGIDGQDVSGKQVWLVLKDTADALRGITEKEVIDELEADHGALATSRVSFEPIPVETVRAAEIADARTLADKVCVWNDASGRPLGERLIAVVTKADRLEKNARAEGLAPEGLHVRICSLRLRGAAGIWRGLGVDEVTLDLDAYEPGLIALVGPNGAGKSTLIENLHPYLQMLTRDGSLAKHFRLKDSRRELRFLDERTGAEYRALILIDPTLATPKTEAYLYENDVPLTTGRVKEYEEQVLRLFGSLDLFVKSAFVAQKPPKGHPDIADATPAERKSLFRELGGLDYLQGYADDAKLAAEECEVEIAVDRGKADVIRPLLDLEPDRKTELATVVALHGAAVLTAANLKERGVDQKKHVDSLEAAVAEQRRIAEKLAGLWAEDGRLVTEARAIDAARETSHAALAGRDAAAAVIEKAEKLGKAREALQDAQTQVLRERERIAREDTDRLASVRRSRDTVATELRILERSAASLAAKKAGLVAAVDALTPEVEWPLDATCPTCGQALPEAKREELVKERDRKRLALEEQREAILGFDNLLIGNEQARAVAEHRLEKLADPAPQEMPTFAKQAELEAVIAQLARLDVAGARETVRLADAAAAQIAAGEVREKQIGERREAIAQDETELRAKVDGGLETVYAAAKDVLDELRAEYAEATAAVARHEQRAAGLREVLADLTAKRATLAAIDERIEAQAVEMAEWRDLERACGRDGIQALELDAMGPSIAEATNRLLDAYGSQFRVEIRTTRIAGRGSKVKQVEDFEIVVRDTESGTEQPMDTLSGGETVIVRKALYDAFGIIRARSTGTRFLTVCLDEADGALDPEARRRYVAMLQAAHDEAGRRHTILISHSEEAQEAVGQKIEMRELARKEVTA